MDNKLLKARFVFLAAVLAIALIAVRPALGYSTLTHEAVIDAVWDSHLKPTLLARFPEATEDDLRDAHAYAYGGCLIHDMGYYPMGRKFYTDAVHYLRTGDFVVNLINESRTLNEYAFALGAMAHYGSDICGHKIGVNTAVARMYPHETAEHHGDSTYCVSAKHHLQVEFAFDVLQVARGKYTTQSYRDFIGFEVAPRVLKAAFVETYGIELEEAIDDLDLSINTFRYSVSQAIPQLTRVAWELKRDKIIADTPDIEREKFLYTMTPAEYRAQWGDEYWRPGPFSKFFAVVFRLLPRIGPIKALDFKPLPPDVEQMMVASFDASVDRFKAMLNDARNGTLDLPNVNLDDGVSSEAGEYKLADKAFLALLRELRESRYREVTPELREALLAFCNGKKPTQMQLGLRDRVKLSIALDDLREARLEKAPTPLTRR